MKIEMTKRKGGIYCQWYEIEGINSYGNRTTYIIYHNQANNYAQAVRFWNKTWGDNDKCKAFVLRNAEPFDPKMCLAC